MEIEEGLLPRHKEKIGIVYKNLEYQENLRETEEYKKINLQEITCINTYNKEIKQAL